MRIDATAMAQVRAEIKELLKSLKVGETVKGKLIEYLDGNATLKTSSGKLLTASVRTDTPLPKGAIVELMISEIIGDNVFAEIKSIERKAQDTNTRLSQLLKNMNMPVSDKTLEIANLFLKYNMPIDKETLAKVMNLQKNAENLSGSSGEGTISLILSDADIQNTPVDVLNKIVLIVEGEVKKKVEESDQPEITVVREEDDQTEEKNSKDSKIKSNNTVNNEEAEIKNKNSKNTVIDGNETSQEEANIDKNNNKDLSKIDGKTDNKGEIKADTKNDTLQATKSAVQSDEASNVDEKNNIPSDKKIEDALKMIKQQNNTSIDKNNSNNTNVTSTVEKTTVSAVQNEEIEAQTINILKKLNIPETEEIRNFVEKTVKFIQAAAKSDTESIVFLVSKDMEITPKNLDILDKTKNNVNKVSDFLDKLQTLVDSHDNKDVREIKEVIKNIFLNPKQLENQEDVKEQMRDIIKLGEKLELLLNKNSINDNEINSTLTNLKDNIDFLKSVNEYNNYLQIPVVINNNNTTAEIYVYKEGSRKKKIDPENATILISLDLKNIGHIESMIVINRKNINVTFRLLDKKTGDILSNKSDDLKNSLEAKGFNLNPLKIIKLDQPFNIISLEEIISEGIQEKINFDMKV